MMKDVKYLILKNLGEPGEIEDLGEKFQEKRAKEEVKSVEERQEWPNRESSPYAALFPRKPE